jgi:hypothetical protein
MGVQKTQVKFVTSVEQAEAIGRVARERGISKQALIRKSLQAVTGVEPGIAANASRDGVYGFASPSHPSYKGARAETNGVAK